jgi:hypothetical protein
MKNQVKNLMMSLAVFAAPSFLLEPQARFRHKAAFMAQYLHQMATGQQ